MLLHFRIVWLLTMDRTPVGRLKHFKEIEWLIDDFENIDLGTIDQAIISPEFTFKYFSFNLKLLGLNARKCHSIFLEVKAGDVFQMQCTLSIKLSDGTLYGSKEATNVRFSQCFPDFIKRSVLDARKDDFLNNKQLTVVISFDEKEKKRTRKRKGLNEEDSIYKGNKYLLVFFKLQCGSQKKNSGAALAKS